MKLLKKKGRRKRSDELAEFKEQGAFYPLDYFAKLGLNTDMIKQHAESREDAIGTIYRVNLLRAQ